MRFAFISPDSLAPNPSSIGLATNLLARELTALGHEVVVVAFSDREKARFVTEDGVVMLPLPKLRPGRIAELWMRWRIRKLLEEEVRGPGLDGVEVPDFLGWLPFGLPGVPVQVRLHNSVTSLCRFRGAKEGMMMRWFERSTLSRASRWVGASEFAFSRTKTIFGICSRKNVTLPCPVDLGDGEPSVTANHDRLRILFCGPLNWLKGGDLLLEIAGAVKERGLNAEFMVAGNDPEGWARKKGDLVTCLGHLPHRRVLDLMRRTAAILAPSRLEFQGLAVAEAMARGVPALLPRRPPFSELFSDREVFFVNHDTPEAWVEKLMEVVADHTITQIVAQAGQAKVRSDLCPSFVTDRWLEMQQRR